MTIVGDEVPPSPSLRRVGVLLAILAATGGRPQLSDPSTEGRGGVQLGRADAQTLRPARLNRRRHAAARVVLRVPSARRLLEVVGPGDQLAASRARSAAMS